MHKRLKGFDFVRTLLAVGIIWYHFSEELGAEAAIRPFDTYGVNGNLGKMINQMFFLLSGCLLYMHYHGSYSLKKYYWKRFRSIYPMFWIAFLYYYIQNVLGNGKLFYQGRPWMILLSVIGMDGYLFQVIPNYYMLGEWFLGMIIMLYVLYPLVQRMIDCFPAITVIAITGLFIGTRNVSIVHPDPQCSIVSCLFSFVTGICVAKYRLYRKKNLNWILLGIAVVLIVLPVKMNGNLLNHIVSIALFAGLYEIGRWAARGEKAGRFWKYLGGLTYPVFLLQHILIIQVIQAFHPVSVRCIIFLLIMTTGFVFMAAWVLKTVTDTVMKTKWFQWIENRIYA